MYEDLDLSIDTFDLEHLSFLRHVIDKMGIYEVFAEIFPKDPRSVVSDADCCVAMMLNILSGRVALYRMSDWVGRWDTDALIGVDKPASAFSDDRLGRALDHVHRFGTDEVLSAVIRRWFDAVDLGPAWCVRLDASTIRLFGAYESTGDVPSAPMPARGFSKDRRPDLKQLVYGLSMVAGSSIPVVSTMHDGNTSDHKVNRFHIEQLASCLPPDEEITIVADSKLVDGKTLGHLLDEEFHFLSRLPRTFKLHAELVERLRGDHALARPLGVVPGNRAHPSPRPVTGASLEATLAVTTPRDGDRDVVLRCLVVNSPRLAQQVETTLPRAVEKDLAALSKRLRKASKKQFQCAEDAEKAACELRGSAVFHEVDIAVEPLEVPEKRRVGRPRRDAPPPPTTTAYVLVPSEPRVVDEAVERRRFHDSHFILVTSHVDQTTWSDADLFLTYREQYEIEGHTGFRWLKGPAAVAPMFLELPSRINALGLMFVLSLMVRNYVQWMVRVHLEETEQEVPYYGDKPPTRTPTAEVIWNLFAGVKTQVVQLGDRPPRRQVSGVQPAAEMVLRVFGLAPEDLTAPRHHGVCWLPGG